MERVQFLSQLQRKIRMSRAIAGTIILRSGQSFPDTIEKDQHYFVARDIVLDCRGIVKIAASANIARGVRIISASHHHTDTMGKPRLVHVTIEEDATIYAYAIIYGSFIGRGAIVSAGTVLLNQHVEPYTLVAGNPAQAIGFFDLEHKRWRYNDQKYDQILGNDFMRL